MKGIVLSATSDIATEMCLGWQEKNWDICGTFFSKAANYKALADKGIPLFFCNFADKQSVDQAAEQIAKHMPSWDFIIFATGSQVPVGPFEKVDIDQWSSSLELNFLNQMRILHKLLSCRDKVKGNKSVLFFAGGGTNNTVVNYSAYTISKIALIKSCELLDSEIPDVKFSIVGPGWVKTKIHEATLQAGEQFAGTNFEKTQKKLNSNECVPMQNVIGSFEWLLTQPKKIAGGRNFSTVFDCWGQEELEKLLAQDENMYKLRRWKNDILVRQ